MLYWVEKGYFCSHISNLFVILTLWSHDEPTKIPDNSHSGNSHGSIPPLGRRCTRVEGFVDGISPQHNIPDQGGE